jgi:hypothetical protein
LDGGIADEAWTGKKVNYYFCEEFVHIGFHGNCDGYVWQ